jgi:ATP-dependent protease Clp ATPase subunit
LPAQEDVQEVIVDRSVVKNNTEPLLIHSKSKKTTAA